MQFQNATILNSQWLKDHFLRHTQPYRHDLLQVFVRYTRSSPFSGACYYTKGRIHVNIGRRNRYPFTLATHVAKATSGRGEWSRPLYHLTLENAEQLALFIYLHELFHYLVHVAGRGRRHKEAMCDRFATRVLVDRYGCRLTDPGGLPPARATWDFKDLDNFVRAAPRGATVTPLPRNVIPVRIVGANYGQHE